MAPEDAVSDRLATLAQATARKVGGPAVRGWQAIYTPRRLYREIHYTLSTGQPFPVWISTLIPGPVEERRAAEPPRERYVEASRPVVARTSRGRRDLLTTTSEQTPARPSMARSS